VVPVSRTARQTLMSTSCSASSSIEQNYFAGAQSGAGEYGLG
jgi:hypothetical protein